METILIWSIWLIVYILIFIAYDREPIKYSNKKIFNISYRNIYLVLIIVTLFIILYILKDIITMFPIVSNINKSLLFIPLLIGLFVINGLKKNSIKNPSEFYLPPNNISKFLIYIYIIILLLLI